MNIKHHVCRHNKWRTALRIKSKRRKKKVIFIKKNAFSRNFQGRIWFKCALSQPENVIATEFSKKTSAHLTKTSVNFCDNIYDALKLFPFRQAYFYILVNDLVQFVFEPHSYLNKNLKYVGTILWKFKHVHKNVLRRKLSLLSIYK